MPTYLSPGVFVEEINSGPRPIEAVGTSTAGFVGKAPDPGARQAEAVAINNWSEFLRIFVPASPQKAGTPNDLANAVYGFFQNGGSRCYVVNTGNDALLGPGLEALERIDEIAIIAAPGQVTVDAYAAMLDSAERMRDRVAILDAPAQVEDVELLTRVAMVAADDRPAHADTKTGPADGDGGAGVARNAGSERPGLRPRVSDRGYGAVYFPWIRARDALDPARMVSVPPSGHMAGIFARTDAERGVHKAPANMAIRGALGLTQIIGRAEQDVLNPAGVNCIRSFSREGIVVWGARTLAPSASEWRYLNVRRLFNMIEESIANSTRWVVFEPNDQPLWKSIRRDIGAFLTLLWRQGALAGASPEEAFFVKCDSETNPPDVIDAGQVVALIGLAPVKPAEFVIFRIGQSALGATVEVG